LLTKKTKQFVFLHGLTSKVTTYDSFKTGSKMFFLGQIGLGWVQRSSKVALKKKGALFGHSSHHLESRTHGERSALQHAEVLGEKGADLDSANTGLR
jgi:hypothetical protein